MKIYKKFIMALLITVSVALASVMDALSSQEIYVNGEITAMTENSLTVGNSKFNINTLTRFYTRTGLEINFEELKTGWVVEVAGVVVANLKIAKIVKLKDDHPGCGEKTVKAEGSVTAVSENSITADNILFNINSETVIIAEGHGKVDFSYIETGDKVRIEGIKNGMEIDALLIKVEKREHQQVSIEIFGEITETAENYIIVNGTKFTVNENTVIKLSMKNDQEVDKSYLKAGQIVNVKGLKDDEIIVAQTIVILIELPKREYVDLNGKVTAISENSITVDNNTSFNINLSTIIYFPDNSDQTAIEIGDEVHIKGYSENGVNFAEKIIVKSKVENEFSIEIFGVISEAAESFVIVNNTKLTIDEKTVIKLSMKNDQEVDRTYLKAGQIVKVKGLKKDEIIVAQTIVILIDFTQRESLELNGKVTGISDNSITLDNSTSFSINSSTVIKFPDNSDQTAIEIGDEVHVKGYTENGVNFAEKIIVKAKVENEFSVWTKGVITSINDGIFTVNSLTFTLNSLTLIIMEGIGNVDGSHLAIGQTVDVKAVLNNNIYLALIVKVYLESNNNLIMKGAISSLDEGSITVNETYFTITGETKFYNTDNASMSFSELEMGSYVMVKAQTDGELNTALSVRLLIKHAAEKEDDGEIDYIDNSTLVCNDRVFTVDFNVESQNYTKIYKPDGSLTSSSELKAGMKVDIKENIHNEVLYASSIYLLSSEEPSNVKLIIDEPVINVYPNPCTDYVKISFLLNTNADVELSLYDVTGKRIMQNYDGFLLFGEQNFIVKIDNNFTSGVYYANLVINGRRFTKMITRR